MKISDAEIVSALWHGLWACEEQARRCEYWKDPTMQKSATNYRKAAATLRHVLTHGWTRDTLPPVNNLPPSHPGASMATSADFQALRRRFDVATTAVATVIRTLTEKLAAGGMTPEDESAALASLNEVADQLERMGSPTEPLPADPGTEEPAPGSGDPEPADPGPGTEG